MKTAQEKAIELFEKMYFAEDEQGYHSQNKHRAKQCAIIAVDEMLQIKTLWYQKDTKDLEYLNEVKSEILKL